MCHFDIFLVILANSVDPDEMQFYATSKERVKRNKAINKFLLFFPLCTYCVKRQLKNRQNEDLNDK